MSRPTQPELHSGPAGALLAWLDRDSSNHATWQLARSALNDISESAAGTGELSDLAEVSHLLARLLDIVDSQTPADSAPNEDIKDILEFVQASSHIVVDAVERDALDGAPLNEMIAEANGRWGDCLTALDGDYPHEGLGDHGLEISGKDSQDEPAESLAIDAEKRAAQISMMLSAMGESDAESTNLDPVRPRTDKPRRAQPERQVTAAETPDAIQLDDDLRDAFVQDATRCLSAIEQTVLEMESRPQPTKHHRQICRELHTLKGASASVGLGALAGFLHEVEESIERSSGGSKPFEIDQLLQAVDMVRRQIGDFSSQSAQAVSEQSTDSVERDRMLPGTNTSASLGHAIEGDGQNSVRVRASTLDRLMDMLAELVVLRNRRETQINDLNLLNQELVNCAARLKQFSDRANNQNHRLAAGEPQDECPKQMTGLAEFGLHHPVREGANARAIAEIANDLTEITRGIKDFYRPIGEENVALTHFIRQFRQEMMQLRRLPVSGLFQRLQRAARDAARSEGKRIQVQFSGHQTAIEQSLQEKLYEPLLHVVRNAVSHGIEDAAARSAGGKSAVGQIVVQISSSANLLGINVSDDGRGLDYDALRRRGYEQGLLSPERSPTRQELAKLIFHPGFSTRDTASAVSGRGVGMDVVATAIDRLHGRIEIDSMPGKGTTIRLSIPLGSGIEHAMIFRSAGQQFALPMYSVSSAQDTHASAPAGSPSDDSKSVTRSVSFARIANVPHGESSDAHRLLVLNLDSGNRGPAGRVNLIVDEIIGGEEVVVRALPRTLKHHPFAGGVTLSGGGEIVLTIDPIRFSELCRVQLTEEPNEERPASSQSRPAPAKRVLVVDDSLSARRSLVKRLTRLGLEVTEASDGMEALSCLRGNSFQLVITDLDMPRLGGLELLGEIRQRRLLDLPVIVITSRTEEAVREQASRRGAQAFLNKPVTDESFASLLQHLRVIAT